MPKMSWREASERLRVMRETGERDSNLVVTLWADVLYNNYHKLDNEVWQVYEQVCVAALDCGRDDLFQDCYEALNNKFGGSARVKRLKAMALEAKGEDRKAEDMYKEMIEKDPTNSMAYKRLVAIAVASNSLSTAVDVLNKYLEDFMEDWEGWSELSELYVRAGELEKAATAFEEVVLNNPHNHLFLLRYAEIKYSTGKKESVLIARQYFAQAVKLCPTNLRALYGMLACTNFLAGEGNSQEKTNNCRFSAWAADQVLKHAKASLESTENADQLEAIKKVVSTLKVSPKS